MFQLSANFFRWIPFSSGYDPLGSHAHSLQATLHGQCCDGHGEALSQEACLGRGDDGDASGIRGEYLMFGVLFGECFMVYM